MLSKIRALILPKDPQLFKEIVLLGFPVIVSNLSRVAMQLTDTAMVGRLGSTQLVGVAMGGMILWIAMSSGIGLRIATQSVTARRLGQEKLHECGLALRNGLVMAMIIGIPLSLVAFFFGDSIAKLFLSDPGAIPICTDYITTASVSILLTSISFVFMGFFTGIEKTREHMYVTIISNLVNVYLNAGLIYGTVGVNVYLEAKGIGWLSFLWRWYEFPAMGAKGAAIATVIAVMFTVLIYTYFLLKDEIRVKYGVLKTNLSSKMMRRQFEIGYPQALSEIMLMFAFGIFYKIIGMIGKEELAASQIALTIDHASFMPALGIGQACSTLVGKYLGKKDIERAEQAMYESARASLMIMGSMGIVFILFPHYLVSFFTNDPEVLKHGVVVLPWIGLLQFVDAIAITFWFALSGAGDTKFTAYTAVLANWIVFIPLSYLFGITLDMGVMGPWYAFGILLLIESILIIFRVRQGKWKHIEV